MLISYLFSPVKVFKIKVIFKARLVKNENAKELTKPRLQCQSVTQAKLVEVSRGQPDSEAEGPHSLWSRDTSWGDATFR